MAPPPTWALRGSRLELQALRAAVLVWTAVAATTATASTPDPASAERGQRLVLSREQGLCVLCHTVPGVSPHLAGNLGPDLSGVGRRMDREALRQRLVDPQRFNPQSIMPSYGPPSALGARNGPARLPPARLGQALVDEQALEDILSYLETLR